MLICEDVDKQFGGIVALDGFDISVDRREIVGLIGPNGAGKTTLFNCVTGIHEPSGGTIEFDGTSLVGARPHEVCRMGIARSFQTPRPIRALTIEENLLAARHFGVDGAADDRRTTDLDETLSLFDLAARRDDDPESLQLMEKKYLDLARALMTAPRLLLLDEIMAGLNPGEKDRMVETVGHLQTEYDLAVLVIEHDLAVIRSLCDRIVVIDEGHNLAEGTATEIFEDERVQRTYVGGA